MSYIKKNQSFFGDRYRDIAGFAFMPVSLLNDEAENDGVEPPLISFGFVIKKLILTPILYLATATLTVPMALVLGIVTAILNCLTNLVASGLDVLIPEQPASTVSP